MASKQWELIPQLALEAILLNMDTVDRATAALTYRNWTRRVYTPNLWKRATFVFPSNIPELQRYKSGLVIKSYGNLIQNLVIKLDPPNARSLLTLASKMKIFFGQLSNSDVKPLCVTVSNLGTYWPPGTFMRKKILGNFNAFLRRQKNIEIFVLKKAHLYEDEGLNLLRALSKGNNYTLKELDITIFFRRHVFIERREIFTKLIRKFRSLEILDISYNLFYEDLMDVLSTNLKDTLKKIRIYVREGTARLQHITPKSWEKMKSQCPNLRVDYNIEHLKNLEECQLILPFEIPLKSLLYRTGLFEDEPNISIKDLLQHVAVFCDTLENLMMVIYSPERRIPHMLEHFVRKCPDLEILSIYMCLPLVNLDLLFDSWLERKPRVQLRFDGRVRIVKGEQRYSGKSFMDTNAGAKIISYTRFELLYFTFRSEKRSTVDAAR